MALSDEEQKLLAQMEAALAADDPKFANTLRGTTTRRLHRKQAAIAGVGFVAGLACLVAGMETHWSISVVGFVLMLISTIVAITSWRHVDFERAERPQGPKVRSSPDNPFMDKLEERWRRRHGDDI
jgi:hypothetical protein